MNISTMLGGRWTLPTIESTGTTVRLHVSVSVEDTEVLSGQPVAVALQAGGQQLAVSEAPPDGAWYYLETLAITAIADFAFDNPDGLTPESVTVTLGGESATWPAELPAADQGPGDFPMV